MKITVDLDELKFVSDNDKISYKSNWATVDPLKTKDIVGIFEEEFSCAPNNEIAFTRSINRMLEIIDQHADYYVKDKIYENRNW